jgi:carbon-monoxide dehydrogenase large subunit
MNQHVTPPKKFGLGQPIRRVEDERLITGRGRYTADLAPAGTLHAVLLRSPHAHARFTITDTKAAETLPGVKAVLTAKDVKGLGAVPCQAPLKTAEGKAMFAPGQPLLCADTVKHVGDAVAMVVAETVAAARDAAEAIAVAYEPLPVSLAMPAPGAAPATGPLVWDKVPGNVAYDQEMGNAAKVADIFAKAHRVVAVTLENNRLVTNYMEGRVAIGEYDAAGESYTLTVSSQGVHGLRDTIAEAILKIPAEKLRVVTPDVGGGFGTKTFVYREYPLLLVAAKKLGRPVTWVQERTEHFIACAQGRANVTKAEMALDRRGRFLAARWFIVGDLGAYPSQYGPYIHWLGGTMCTGPYDIPALHLRVQGIYTNTLPVDAYRGAGRPEAAYVLERLVDTCAREMGMKPDVIRARNFVKPSQMPYKTQTKRSYDVGEFEGHMRAALDQADWAGFPARLKAAKKAGKLRGIGFASYIECTAWGSGEDVQVSLAKDGGVTLLIGTQSNGQGHATAYAQAVAQALDLPVDRITVVQGDTAAIRTGHGTGGSRSIPVGAVSALRASEALGDKLKQLASEKLEAAVADLVIADGAVGIAGTDRKLSFSAIAALPKATPDMLSATNEFVPPDATYPNGTHVAELEVDPETGTVSIRNYVIVDDFGLTVNPLLLEGQVHGGIAQGIGQAFLERTVYDESGQLLSASLMDYCMPRADDLPSFRFSTRNVPSTTNPLGIKGAGEAGSIGSCPAVMNALIDALDRSHGIRQIDMPATPERVWRAIAQAQGKI